MRVFVTGAAGLIGMHLVRRFLDAGAEVIAVDNLSAGYPDNLDPRARFVCADCEDLSAMRRAFARDGGSSGAAVDVVYHCAASPHEGLSVWSPHVIAGRSIYSATLSVLSAAVAAGVRRFVFCSSMARFGDIPAPFRESDTPHPVDPYGCAKLAAEQQVALASRVHGIEYVIAVPHNVVGVGQRYCMARGSLIKTTRGFKPIETVGRGDEVSIGEEYAHVESGVALGRQSARRIGLGTRQQVTVGLDHKFRVLSGEHLTWKSAASLTPGDRVLSETPGHLVVDRASKDFRFGQFVGLLISDGSYNDDYSVNIACCIEADKPDMRRLLDALVEDGVFAKWRETDRGHFYIDARALVLRLRQLGLHATAHDKVIPAQILAMSHDVVVGVLSGLFSGDGWITTAQNVVAFACVSEALVRQVQQVLLAYGMKSTVAKREPAPGREIEGRPINSGPIWYVTVLGEAVTAFKAVGFVYGRKQAALNEKGPIKEAREIPGLGKIIAQVGPFLPTSVRVRKPNALNTPRDGITQFSLRQLIDMIDIWLASPEAAICAEYTQFVCAKRDAWFALLACGYFLEVMVVEDVEAELFDISIDAEHHSYIGDGLVMHNCDPFRNVVGIMVNRCLQGRPPIIYGDGEQTRSFSAVSDTVDCLVRMADAKVAGRVINIGPDHTDLDSLVTVNDLARRVQVACKTSFEPIHVADRPQEVKHAYCSSALVRELLGYVTRQRLDEVITQMVAWIRRRGPQPFRYHLPIEIRTDRTPRTWTERMF